MKAAPSRPEYVAELSPAQLAAHKRIAALQKVYDAVREVLRADEILDVFPDDAKSQDRFSEAMSDLHAAVWNTAAELGEPYPGLEDPA